jgi:predicted dehydrogenase
VFDERRLGKLKALQLRRHAYTPDYALHNWNLDPKLAGGAILDLHVHDVDYALYLLGKPASIAAQGCRSRSGAVDRIHALWHYPSGPAVQIEGSWDIPPGFEFNMGFTAVFENGAIVWDMSAGKPLTVYRPNEAPETPVISGGNGYYAEIDYLLGCIERGEHPQGCTPAESRDAVAVALAEKDGCGSGRPVMIT